MRKRDLVSVIIPVYNRENMICDAVESVLNQTYEQYEIIVADDGSTDNTISQLKKYSHLASFHCLKLNHSGFPGKVRNQAVELAKGKWIAFLDSDDLWMPEKLEKQLDYLETHQNSKIIHTLEKWVRNGKTISQSHRKHQKEGDLFNISLGKCEIGPSTVVMEKSLFLKSGGFREDLEICEDYDLWLKITSLNTVAYIDEALVIKNAGHEDQLSAKYDYIELFKINSLKDLVDKRAFPEARLSIAKKELARKCKIYSKGCQKRGKDVEAKKYESLYFLYSIDDALIEG
ncbi:MAG: glycosyltransferase [Spirochaetaceae bacterium]|jgi:glycosyltransferase involved in cell wall biosynthesis|nr:glycosyltransferase [Spirochaetaceae bacterium]